MTMMIPDCVILDKHDHEVTVIARIGKLTIHKLIKIKTLNRIQYFTSMGLQRNLKEDTCSLIVPLPSFYLENNPEAFNHPTSAMSTSSRSTAI